jgi:hypothetical protein
MENKTLLPRLFASLSSLEQSFEFLMDKLAEKDLVEENRSYTKEISKVLTRMRRTANLLQMAVAKNEILSAFRLLNVFYGLNYMVRPELVQALDKLSAGINPITARPEVGAYEELH